MMFELVRRSKLDKKFEAMELGLSLYCEGKKSAPDPPDYSGIATASKEAAELSAAVALEQLDWTKQQWADQKEVLDQIMTVQLPMMEEQWQKAQEDRARYEEMYQPMEDEYLRRASEWDTQARRDQEAAKAQTDVAAQFEAARKNALQRLESYGVDPSQTRNAALDIGVRTEEAKAKAQQANNARTQIEKEGMGMLGESINVGRGMASQGLNYAGQSLAAGQGGQNSAAAWQGASNAMGSPSQWMQNSDTALGTWGNALTAGYQGELGAWQAQQANSPWNTIAQGVGLASGIMALAEGGEAMAIPYGVHEGDGEVEGPGGPKDDAIDAKVSDGEYVVPEEVVRRKGTEFFDKLVEKVKAENATRMQNAQVGREALAIPPDAAIPGMAEGGEARSAITIMGAGGGPTEIPSYGGGYGGGAAIPQQVQRLQQQYAAPQVAYTPNTESDMRDWMAYRKAAAAQALNNQRAQQQYAWAMGRKFGGGEDDPMGQRLASTIRNNPVSTPTINQGEGAARFQQRFDSRTAALKARLPALKAKYNIK